MVKSKSKRNNTRGGDAILSKSIRMAMPAQFRHSTTSQLKEKLDKGKQIETWEVGFDDVKKWGVNPEKYNFTEDDMKTLADVIKKKREEKEDKIREQLRERREKSPYTPERPGGMLYGDRVQDAGGKTRKHRRIQKKKGRKSRKSKK
jgi:hypothetical protein